MARYFTVDEAEQLLPVVERELRHAITLQAELAAISADLRAYTQRIEVMGGVMADRQKIIGLRSRVEVLAGHLKECVRAIHAHGCQVKDLGSGLLDFPTLYRGEEVLLCWKLGESGITHYHGLSEGFRGRKPIDEEFLANHGGE